MADSQIGIVGTGRIGTAMCKRLIETGHAVTVWNRSADRT
jgi:3-hydroxyisobutyrate dehydrogenase